MTMAKEEMTSQAMFLDFKSLHTSTQTTSLGYSSLLLYQNPLPSLAWPTVPQIHPSQHLRRFPSPLYCPYCFSVQLIPSKSCPVFLNLGCILELSRELLKRLCLGSTSRGSHVVGLGWGPSISIILLSR